MKRRLEKFEQIDAIAWLKKNNIFFFSIPNESKRHFGELANMKKLGLHKGASDLVIMLDDVIVMCEMKRVRTVLKSGLFSTSKSDVPISDEQIEFQKTVNKYPYGISIICYGFEDFKRKMNIIINRKKK